MNQDQTNPTEEKNADQSAADELKLQSEVEASEQLPIEEDPIAKLTADLAEQKDNYLRLYADFENYKKRALKERSDLIKSAGSDTLAALLPVLDDFDRAMKAMETASDNPVKEGVTLIHTKLISTLEQRGLKVMTAIGEEFNVDMHEAITNIPVADESQKGKVVDVLEKGYYLNDKVIRYAKVVVGN
jgi:molecular chaperone GrpE